LLVSCTCLWFRYCNFMQLGAPVRLCLSATYLWATLYLLTLGVVVEFVLRLSYTARYEVDCITCECNLGSHDKLQHYIMLIWEGCGERQPWGICTFFCRIDLAGSLDCYWMSRTTLTLTTWVMSVTLWNKHFGLTDDKFLLLSLPLSIGHHLLRFFSHNRSQDKFVNGSEWTEPSRKVSLA
jgi:hypothetical protein